MKLKGKELKRFFTSARGVLIERDNMYVFVDCEKGKTNVVIKPKSEQIPDEPKIIIFSNVFDAVQTLDDESEYYFDIVFNTVMFEKVDQNGKVITELVISGERY